MVTATFNEAFQSSVSAPETQATQAKVGFFEKLAKGFIAAREAEARRRIAHHLASVPDVHFAKIGMSARDIELLRQGARFNVDLTS